ncbi:hypothetical protein ATCV1_Z782L [Acanthocystis turfacea chlorella virus 1]|uniref:Uncharacterized protein Z782L n=1 Tax=Chlorovirus heliozoae TaxID=322019 RepID=A7KA42_9PHYC|nr:hypothetical protein ATCV1_Z782L [Acanthocystis turfacea chlorella virus 1]ABT16916.1 hypothetical protein ATCV1_Z782L [Acanthocystis turfacea chlorella virus 1]
MLYSRVFDIHNYAIVICTMTVLQYYWADGTHTTFSDYDINENGIITNVKINQVMSRIKTADGYNRVAVRHEGNPRNVLVGRALASTFIGKPQTLEHTVDHIDKNRENDVLKNIIWEDKSGQRWNQGRPSDYKTAFIIVKNEVEHTVSEWTEHLKNETNPYGGEYTAKTIRHYARRQQYEFRYKQFPNLRGEVWKFVPGSKNSKGEWFISNKNRVKYKTRYAENVLTVDQMTKQNGYPVIGINGKQWKCHELAMMTFRPNEYAAKDHCDIILHKNDDKTDFNPFRLRWGTPPENTTDAYNNGKYDGTKSARKPVASYVNDVLETEHISIRGAARYLRDNGYLTACQENVRDALKNGGTRYGRTWKLV